MWGFVGRNGQEISRRAMLDVLRDHGHFKMELSTSNMCSLEITERQSLETFRNLTYFS